MSTANDEEWKRLRTVVTPTFSSGSLKRMKPRINDTVQTLSKNFNKFLEKENVLNVKELYGAYTMDTVVRLHRQISLNIGPQLFGKA